ncbi:MAG: protein-glutamate O-methyltransferase CheR [Steroidobacteraceae bacterium]|jgi:chemotaxis protein methyltransferase CheR
MNKIVITDHEFAHFQRFIYAAAGVTLPAGKKTLVGGRLAKRLQQYGLGSYGEYFQLLSSGREAQEVQTAVDLLTTNETSFFREPKHFKLLREVAITALSQTQPFRVWCAACSTGEEAYSIAMVLADCLEGGPWEVVGSDISKRVLERARGGHYSAQRAGKVPRSYLHRFFLKGVGTQLGTVLVDRALRERVRFVQINLDAPLPHLGVFDLIFLRNVMIYFNNDTKRQVVARALSLLKAGGYLLIGHSETLSDLTTAVKLVAPSIYRKP